MLPLVATESQRPMLTGSAFWADSGGMKKLKAWLTAQKHTGAWLADKMKLDRACVSRWLTGARRPNLATLRKIAKATGIPLAELLD